MPSLREWLDEQWERRSLLWIKRLSGSDTLVMGEQDAGPKIPRQFILEILPEYQGPRQENQHFPFVVSVDSNNDDSVVTASLFMDKWMWREDGSRVLVPDWGGALNPLLDPENTGAVAVLAFQPSQGEGLPSCDAWVCANLDQEGIVESDWGAIEPGFEICWSHTKGWMTRNLL